MAFSREWNRAVLQAQGHEVLGDRRRDRTGGIRGILIQD
jgi:hypothetical protein